MLRSDVHERKQCFCASAGEASLLDTKHAKTDIMGLLCCRCPYSSMYCPEASVMTYVRGVFVVLCGRSSSSDETILIAGRQCGGVVGRGGAQIGVQSQLQVLLRP